MKTALLLSLVLLFSIQSAYSQGFERIFPNGDGKLIREEKGLLEVIYRVPGIPNGRLMKSLMDYEGNIVFTFPPLDVYNSDTLRVNWEYACAYGIDNSLLFVYRKKVASNTFNILIKSWDKHGQFLWETSINDTSDNNAYNLVVADDGSIFVFHSVRGPVNPDFAVTKLDALGNIQWTKEVGAYYSSMVVLPNGSIALQKLKSGALLYKPNSENILELNDQGDIVQTHDGMVFPNYSPSLMLGTLDSGFISVGSLDTSNPQGSQTWVTINKYNTSFDSVWQVQLGDAKYNMQRPSQLLQRRNRDIIVCGWYTVAPNTSDYGLYIAAITNSGQKKWLHFYQVGYRQPHDVIELPNGDIYMYGIKNADAWVMKTDSMGRFTDNTLSGTVYIEGNATCVYDQVETPLHNWLVELDGNYVDYYANSDTNGAYFTYAQQDNYTINVLAPSPYWDPCIEDIPYTFQDTVQHDTIDFGAHPIILCPWVEVSIAGLCWIRPGGSAGFSVKYCNYGTLPSGAFTVNVTLPPEILVDNVSAPYTQNGNTYTFMANPMAIGECETIYFSGTIDTNTVNGQIICVNANLSADSICIPNYSGYLPYDDWHCAMIRTSYDPNAKVGNPFGETEEHYIEENTRLSYTVQFQNTGNDTAFRVIIIDTLPPELDVSTLTVGASSHEYEYKVYGPGIVKFIFDPIILPDSNVNEPASHGFVKFSIEQQPNLPDGTVFENSVAIYFDYNDAVITEPWKYTIGEPLGIREVSSEVDLIKLYPNPGKGLLTLEALDAATGIDEVEVYDATGKLVMVNNAVNALPKYQLNVGDLAPGIKLIRVKVGDNWVTRKYVLF